MFTLIFVNISLSIILVTACDKPEDARLSFEELAKKYGHSPERYQVVTDDGYILSLFRLPGSRGIPVLLQHGAVDSSKAWIIRGNDSLAITLANAKYDVWMANLRGNTLSRKHVHFDADKDPAFWDYSLDEMGLHDVSVIIDTILSITGAKKLNAIGHSLGNAVFFILGSKKPQYNDKLNIMIALGPICFMHDLDDPFAWLSTNLIEINALLVGLHIDEMLGKTTAHLRILEYICADPMNGYEICLRGLLFSITGTSDTAEINPAFYQIVRGYFPAGISRKALLHFAQIAKRKKFAQFDYGLDNIKVYNSTDPPDYDLGKVSMRVVLVAGRNDKLSIVKNVNRLRKRLPNVVDYMIHPRKRFSHLDFTWGETTKNTLFPYIFQILNKFSYINS